MSEYIYEAILTPAEEGDGGYDVMFPDLSGCFSSGDDLQDAVSMAMDAAKTWVASVLKDKGTLPPTAYHEAPSGSIPVMIAFETSPDYLVEGPVVSAAEASRRLGVTPGRVTQMLSSGQLDGYREGRRTWVSVASISARLKGHQSAGRPAKKRELVEA